MNFQQKGTSKPRWRTLQTASAAKGDPSADAELSGTGSKCSLQWWYLEWPNSPLPQKLAMAEMEKWRTLAGETLKRV